MDDLVTPADREALVALGGRYVDAGFADEIRRGLHDDHERMRVIVQHRASSVAALRAENLRLREALESVLAWWPEGSESRWPGSGAFGNDIRTGRAVLASIDQTQAGEQ